ncbi:MAG: transporter [Terricaulis sp.]
MNRFAQVVCIGAAIAASGAGIATAETEVSFASGANYSSGDYGGTTDTEVFSAPFAIRAKSGSWSFRASTSYLSITGPADVAEDAGGDSGDGAGGTILRAGTEQGIGDTNLAVSYRFSHLGGSRAYFEATGRVRLPTGDDDKGLGVGTTDYGLSGELGINQRGGGAALELTRRFLGDRTGGDRHDGWQVNTSAWVRVGERAQLGAFGSWREATSDGREDPAQIGGYVSYRISPQVRVAINAAAGLSDSSADYSTGVRLTWQPGEAD